MSQVGVTVPESGAAGEGICDDSLREEKMPDKMAVPRVPIQHVSQTMEEGTKVDGRAKLPTAHRGGLTAAQDCQGTLLSAI